MSTLRLPLTPTAALAAGSTYTAALLAPSGVAPWALAAGGAALTAATIWSGHRDRRRLERRAAQVSMTAAQASERVRRAVDETLVPVAEHLGALAWARDVAGLDALRGTSVDTVLQAASRLPGAGRARACWFELVPGSRPGTRSLHPRRHAGLDTRPTTVFVEGTVAGDAVLHALDDARARFVEDVAAQSPTGWDDTERSYRTFIAVPVTAAGHCYGMLTVDAARPGDLVLDDVPLVRLMGQLLADALAIGEAAPVSLTLPLTRGAAPTAESVHGEARSRGAHAASAPTRRRVRSHAGSTHVGSTLQR